MNHQRLNNEGYPDPTPYEAFREMEREERKAKRAFRPIVYICSPYGKRKFEWPAITIK